MWVVKLGGSLAYSKELPRWLETLARLPVVVVPGGGPFADTVRDAQKRIGFSDQVAHEMALLAMQQYGRMLAAASDGLGFLKSIEPQNLPAVWLPAPDALNYPEIPASWEVTSDSLALWLASRVGAEYLLLVKGGWTSMDEPGEISAIELNRTGVVDGAFPGFFRRYGITCGVCGAADHARLTEAGTSPAGRFTRIAD
ncbi:MAG: amino acid kinase [Methylococcaceae bacterium]|nr:amino acid kinase [Methylococcaceae bacterium]